MFCSFRTSRDSSFSGNADLPGTLTRKLMFLMRDLYTAYDGTVRNAYGNQLVQFSYDIDMDKSDSTSTSYAKSTTACDGIGGQPVGSLSACALSEAAYSALDQPVSLLETSPLLNLKNILECGSKKSSAKQNYVSIFIPRSLEDGGMEIVRKRRLKVHSVVDFPLCKVQFSQTRIKSCSSQFADYKQTCNGDDDTFCITVTMPENSKNSSEQLDIARDLVIPFLLGTVVKGFLEVKKVDILWNDHPRESKKIHGSSGELYLRVSMSGKTGRRRLWSMLMDNCLQIMNLIDWSRSHPDNVHDYCIAYGIDAGWKYFLNSPGACFIKAAKGGVVDELHGSVEALAWGNTPPSGTGRQFDILYSKEGLNLSKPLNPYDLLGSQISSSSKNAFETSKAWNNTLDKCDVTSIGLEKSESVFKSVIRKYLTINDIQKWTLTLKRILRKYDINESLTEGDKSILKMALHFHPHKVDKMGSGVQDIKVGQHPKHENARCFMLVRIDRTEEDFSYHKCVMGALEIVAPERAKSYGQNG
ncbi:unnamed protein product [Prunus armeniaca]|uniref:DNA-directed RNA polymerase n=1 Tax=Prunus armeniaca TaxID=36596 RepID=A0A6J5UXC7_PRUAR|nr:unnamed protein product [Prunus armeniaca]